jgi:hypothetical protein
MVEGLWCLRPVRLKDFESLGVLTWLGAGMENITWLGFEVLTAVSTTNMAVFWVVAPCSLIALMMEAARSSETLVVNFYQTT